MEVRIEKGIPLPPKVQGRRKSIYPWRKMNIGDSFLFPQRVKKTTASSLSYRAGRDVVGEKVAEDGKRVQVTAPNGKAFAIRVMAEGIRCWRTE